MAGQTILILGGGFGGVAAAHALRHRLSDEHRIVLVERNATFSMGLSLLWLMSGARQDPREGERPLPILLRRGIEWVGAEIEAIDPERRVARTTAGVLAGDFVVIALRPTSRPKRSPGSPKVPTTSMTATALSGSGKPCTS
jgi:sulfide:quinone oxidoreductase